EIGGSLRINDKEVDFTGGRGYCEKDWGKSFPKAYIWMQSNHFADPGASYIASVAIIPWVRNASFPGFIIGFRYQGILYRFATYTGARLESMAIDDRAIHFAVSDRRYRLEVKAERGAGGLLSAPVEAGMAMRIPESLQGRISVRLWRLTGRRSGELFCGLGEHAGVDAAGDLGRLLSM
ncbi:hypothetical protein JXO59_09790, partial [candidate division KSB1 bacterium]|nr:hypothetical protein [candidate division KSB1 bacterium]